jgi:hypothetical protein
MRSGSGGGYFVVDAMAVPSPITPSVEFKVASGGAPMAAQSADTTLTMKSPNPREYPLNLRRGRNGKNLERKTFCCV